VVILWVTVKCWVICATVFHNYHSCTLVYKLKLAVGRSLAERMRVQKLVDERVKTIIKQLQVLVLVMSFILHVCCNMLLLW